MSGPEQALSPAARGAIFRDMSTPFRLAAGLAASLALLPALGCTVHHGADAVPSTSGNAGETGGPPGAADAVEGTPAPEDLVGTWTAGRGGTTVSYDAITETSSSNASGLAFQFAADGTFAKAYRDATGGSCGTILVGTESGRVAWGDGRFQLEPSHGESRMWSSCSPGAVASQPLGDADLDHAGYAFELAGEELLLTRATDGASARFRRSR